MFDEQEYHKQYYKANPKKWIVKDRARKNATQRRYMDKHKEKRAAYKRNFVEKHYEWNLVIQSRRSAKTKGLLHTIAIDDIKIPELCPYLQVPLTRTQGEGTVWTNASIDRVDNTQGYTPDNVQIVSRLANSIKRDCTLEQLRQFARSVLALHPEETLK